MKDHYCNLQLRSFSNNHGLVENGGKFERQVLVEIHAIFHRTMIMGGREYLGCEPPNQVGIKNHQDDGGNIFRWPGIPSVPKPSCATVTGRGLPWLDFLSSCPCTLFTSFSWLLQWAGDSVYIVLISDWNRICLPLGRRLFTDGHFFGGLLCRPTKWKKKLQRSHVKFC